MLLFRQNFFSTQRLLYISLFCSGLVLRPFITCIYPFSTFFSSNFHMSALEIASLTSIPIFCMGVFAILGRYLERYFNREWIIFTSIGLIAFGFISRSFSNTIFIATVIGSIGIGVAGALIGGLVKDRLPEHSIKSMSIYSLGIGIGAVSGSQIMLSVWRINQIILGIIVIICATIFSLIFCKGKPVRHHPYSPTIRIPISVNTVLSLIIVIFGLQSLINYTLLTWITSYYQSIQFFNTIDIDKLASTLLIVQLISSYFVPQLIAHHKDKILSLNILVGLLSLSIILLYTNPVSMFWLIMCGLGITSGAIFPLSMSLPIMLSKDANQASAWFISMLCFGYLISAMGPLLFGLTLTISSSYSLPLAILLALSGMLFVAVLTLKYSLKRTYAY